MVVTTAAGDVKQTTIEDILKNAPIVKDKSSGDDKKSEDKPPVEKSNKPEKPEKPESVSVKPEEIKIADDKNNAIPELTDEQKIWKKDHEQKSNWEKAHTKRSQIISKYSDEEILALSARMQLEDKSKDFKAEPLPEVIEVTDEFGDKIKVKSDDLNKLFAQQLEQNRSQWIKEYAPKIVNYDNLEQGYKKQIADASNQAAIVRLNEYYNEFPDMKIDFEEDPIQKFNDIKEAGETHPDYNKFLDLHAVAERAAMKKISMKDAHNELFGKRDQQKKADKVLEEERNAAQQERPGKSGKIVTKDEEFNKSLGIGVKHENVFE